MPDNSIELEQLLANQNELKRDKWEWLVQMEAEGKLPDGISIVEEHDKFCSEIDTEWSAFLKQIDAIHAETAREKAAMQQRAEDVISKMHDAVIDHHLNSPPVS